MVHALRGINQLRTAPRHPEFYGGSSVNVMIEAVQTSEADANENQDPGNGAPDIYSPENRAQLWLGGGSTLSFGKASGALLPPESVANEYVHRYFQTAHRIFPILNRKLLVDSCADYWNGLPTEGKGYEYWTAVMYMAIALGHQYSLIDPDEDVRKRALASPQHGEACFQLAKSTLSDVPFMGGDISAVNSLLLAFLWLSNEHRLHEAYTVLGVASRIGYGIGLHRDLRFDPKQTEQTPHIIGWCSTFWCLFTYEREMVAFLGRPCAVEVGEVDIKSFNLETSPVDLQYVERMRQFAYVTWDAYNHVYSLSFKHASVADRGDALRRADRAYEIWFNSWFHDCTWAKEPHGLVARLRFLHMRLLLYRVFLNLLVQKSRRKEAVAEELQELATTCIHVAADIVSLTVRSVYVGVRTSGTLQGALFHAMAYLWNALVTLLLYASSRSAQQRLGPKLKPPINIIQEIKSAMEVFDSYKEAVAFARTASQKITALLEKIEQNETKTSTTASGQRVAPPSTSPASLLDWTIGPEVDFPNFDASFNDFQTFFNMDLDTPLSQSQNPDEGQVL
ncbi:uncharacterized protein A1O5_05575 [Cladophialophora psammophila CBS 110553]|uniref:Xylanolytic transcriptional activator regulatory domain-containing protein n=1 Tax=Cladophialophora psammophila CBS 110553 TaxID=1182543 RepID=W9X372_9EURO|nr:uncharacterized protein A1O5_05575 [Cladophialophora psammophila CBS 110553]EXJ71765.1 hypothetical protein A1O5_05575 [Cladophialophora psammophila CBS 110553]